VKISLHGGGLPSIRPITTFLSFLSNVAWNEVYSLYLVSYMCGGPDIHRNNDPGGKAMTDSEAEQICRPFLYICNCLETALFFVLLAQYKFL
jgi:hypothetical protein